jgi:phosphopantothenoylcysteine decarboxylase/phosphopantothenate--cysteine ligase
MNTGMYQNRIVQENMEKLKRLGVRFIEPGEGLLACGDIGVGRMAEPEEIISAIREYLARKRDFAGVRMLITAGPTVEPIDPVRFLTNRSSGKMGYALAAEAAGRGALVTLISGPVSITPPPGAHLICVSSAEEMYRVVMENKNKADVIIKCAAVADYTPVRVSRNKIKKGESFTLELKATKDILSELGKGKKSVFLVGFAAETDHVLEYAKKKLKEKNLDIIVANDVSDTMTGFDSEDNAVSILHRDGREANFGAASKESIAGNILDEIQIGRNKGF